MSSCDLTGRVSLSGCHTHKKELFSSFTVKLFSASPRLESTTLVTECTFLSTSPCFSVMSSCAREAGQVKQKKSEIDQPRSIRTMVLPCSRIKKNGRKRGGEKVTEHALTNKPSFFSGKSSDVLCRMRNCENVRGGEGH